MTKKHLYPNKFFDWIGWDIIKYPFAISILAFVLWAIWSRHTGQDTFFFMPELIRSAIAEIEKFIFLNS